MFSKKAWALSCALAIFIGLKMSSIYVPDEFESPTKYRLFVSILSFGKFVVSI